MSYGEVDHFATMLSGCESINSGNAQSPDARYAFSVLKLHASDMGYVAGQEGFLDTVKRAANGIKEWFLSLVKAIGNFINDITGRSKKLRELEAEVERKRKETAADKEKAEQYEQKLSEIFTTAFKEPLRLSKQAYEDVKSSGCLDRDAFESLNVSNMRIHGGTNAIQTLNFEAAETKDPSIKSVTRELEVLKSAITELTYASERQVSDWLEEDIKTEKRKDITSAAFVLKKFTQVLGWYEDGVTRYYQHAEKVNP